MLGRQGTSPSNTYNIGFGRGTVKIAHHEQPRERLSVPIAMATSVKISCPMHQSGKNFDPQYQATLPCNFQATRKRFRTVLLFLYMSGQTKPQPTCSYSHFPITSGPFKPPCSCCASSERFHVRREDRLCTADSLLLLELHVSCDCTAGYAKIRNEDPRG